MSLTYIDYNKCKYKNIVKKIYLDSFSKAERFPFLLLVRCSKEDNISFNVIYDDKTVIGFQYIIDYNGISYLMYFAIDSNNRNKGYGSEILKQLTNSNSNILLCIEKPSNQKELKYKRKIFYLKNGFLTTNKFIIDNNVEYELLCNNIDLNITKELLQGRYINMTKSKIIRYIISKMFNVNDIEVD